MTIGLNESLEMVKKIKAAYEVLKEEAITCSPLTDSGGYSPLQFVCSDKYGVTWCLFI